MKKRFVFIYLLPFLFSLQSVRATNWIQESIDLTINARFDSAETLLSHRIQAGDSSVAVYFYYASLLNSKMTHFENNKDAARFLKMLHKVIVKCNRRLRQTNLSAVSLAKLYFYRGSAFGYRAFFEGKGKQWWPALKDGLRSIKDLNKAVETDSTLYDAYLGIGVYKYWRSTKLKFLLWTPFFSDERRQGINDIKIAVARSRNSRYMAMHQLIYILLDYGRFDQALTYAQKVIAAYPHSPFMWWAYAHTLYKRHENKQALKAYDHLLMMIENNPQANPSHWLTCHLRKAEIYKRMGEVQNYANECRLGLRKQWKDPLSKPGQEALAKMRGFLEELKTKQ